MSVMRSALARAVDVIRGEWVGLDEERRPLVRWEGGPASPEVALLAEGALPPGVEAPDEPQPVLLLFCAEGCTLPVLLSRLTETVPLHQPPAHLELEAEESLSLRCGPARVELDRQGDVKVRGKTILSRAKGTHRIKGGAVHIN